MTKAKKPYIIGIAGGTASGKTAVAEILKESHPNNILLITHDNYYKAYGEIPKKKAITKNFDYPGSVDNRLFISHLKKLIAGKKIRMPLYNFFTHARRKETIPADPKPVIIIEGILALSNPLVRKMMDLKIFIDADTDVRLARRLERDLKERDRSLKYSITQYLKSAAPMYKLYVEPTKRYADIIVNNNSTLDRLANFLDLIQTKIDKEIKQRLNAKK